MRRARSSSSVGTGRSLIGRSFGSWHAKFATLDIVAPISTPTHLICYEDAYQRSVTTTVLASGPEGVVLAASTLFPGGGGQPADHGVLADGEGVYTVDGVKKVDGRVIHKIAGADRPAAGAEVEVEVDWDRRHLLMRTHTAMHILCGVVFRDYGAQVTGGDMEPGAGRMDFELQRLDAELVAAIESAINAEVAAARPIEVRHLPRREAFRIPDLIRTKINLLPAGIETVRIVDIVGLDLQADGGTHVANTAEVGPLAITDTRSKGAQNKRIYLRLGDSPDR